METRLKTGGAEDSDSGLSALQSLKHITCSKPRMLTESEIELLRQSKHEIADRVAELIAKSKNSAA